MSSTKRSNLDTRKNVRRNLEGTWAYRLAGIPSCGQCTLFVEQPLGYDFSDQTKRDWREHWNRHGRVSNSRKSAAVNRSTQKLFTLFASEPDKGREPALAPERRMHTLSLRRFSGFAGPDKAPTERPSRPLRRHHPLDIAAETRGRPPPRETPAWDERRGRPGRTPARPGLAGEGCWASRKGRVGHSPELPGWLCGGGGVGMLVAGGVASSSSSSLLFTVVVGGGGR